MNVAVYVTKEFVGRWTGLGGLRHQAWWLSDDTVFSLGLR